MDGNILTTVLTVCTIIACAVTGLTVGTVRTLRDSNSDLRGRVADLESSDRSKTLKITELTADRDAAVRMATGEAHWLALGEHLDLHHAEAREAWRKADQRFEQVTPHIEKVERLLEILVEAQTGRKP